MFYKGLDYHRGLSYVTILNDKGDIVGQKKLSSNGQTMHFLKEFDDGKGGQIARE
jgi:hypothetical protein